MPKTMTGVERVLAAASLQPTDQTPVMPVTLMQGAQALSIPLERYFGTPDKLAAGQTALQEILPSDAVFAIPHIVQDVLPWGSGLDFHPNGPPSVNKMVIRNLEDIPKLTAPNPTKHTYLRHTLRAAQDLAKRHKGKKLIVGALIGPFSLPSMLMGTRKFLELLLAPQATQQRYLHPLMELMLSYTTSWANALHQAGCDIVVFAEGIASASILDETTFQSTALPVMKRFTKSVAGLTALEFVGHAEPFLPHVKDLPVAAYLLGESDDVPRARHHIGPRKAIIGTLNNLKLLRWSAERVEFEAHKLISKAGPGFILSNQGPEVPWDTPHNNIRAILRAAQRARLPRRAA